MKYALVAAGAALAPLASAAIQHGQRHAAHHHHHRQRDLVTEYDVETVTVTQYVTAGAPSSASTASFVQHQYSHVRGGHSKASSSSSHTSSTSAPAAPSSTAAASTKSSSTKASTTTPAASPTAYAASSATKEAAAPSSYASSSTKAASASSSGISKSSLSPNGKKAGLSGYPGIVQNANEAFSAFADVISWYSDYTANTTDAQGVMGIPMLWGADGSACADVVPERLDVYNDIMSDDVVPTIMFGFYEPDCTCDMSSDMTTSDGTTQWNSLIAPLAKKGTILGSPSMCKQKDEDWLTPFKQGGLDADWDVTSLHINKPSIDGVKEDVEYYWNTYKKPMWITEFACVDDKNGFTACTDQTQINTFIQDAVAYFESNENVVAYGASNGEGLGTVWPLTTSDGGLSETGKTYLSVLQSL